MSTARVDDSRALSEREKALLDRLLSDPQNLPVEYKAWLISYLEGSEITLPISSIVGLNQRLATVTALRNEITALKARVETLEKTKKGGADGDQG